ncbi:M16 family metallopeptidase [Mesorhizobium ciceri]|uniref:M16 family metallopeptidase n=1 Tax=Mesorhizobium TaxID=68287 RepID=UPI0009DCB3F6|nr:pitrilysin family protein [Mesorhizobium ciceri]
MRAPQYRGTHEHSLPFPLVVTHGGIPGPRTALAIFLLAILFLVLPPLTAHAAMSIQEVKSAKGINAWLVEDHTNPIITINFFFDGGTTQDPPGKEGLANLMARLVPQGAGDLDGDAFQTKLDRAGATMTLEARRDGVHGAMSMLSLRKDAAFDLLGLALNRPRFEQEATDRIRAQILSGIIGNENEPNAIAEREWLSVLYGSHPYSRPEEGTKSGVAGVSPADLRASHKATFGRDGLHFVVVGDIDANALREKLDQVFGELPPTQALAPVADVTPQLGQQVKVKYDLPQTSLTLAYPGVKRDAPDFHAAMLMNDILGGSAFTSRLFQEVREKRGFAYYVHSDLFQQQHSETLLVRTATRPDRAAETLSLVRDVVKQMAERGPTEAELAAAKKHQIGAYPINYLNSSASIAATLLDMQLNNFGIDYIQRRAGLIEEVTIEQVKAVAKKLLSTEPAIMIVGPHLEHKG